LKHHGRYEELIEQTVLGLLATEDTYALARLATENPIPAMRAAAEMRYRLFGPRISYSRLVADGCYNDAI